MQRTHHSQTPGRMIAFGVFVIALAVVLLASAGQTGRSGPNVTVTLEQDGVLTEHTVESRGDAPMRTFAILLLLIGAAGTAAGVLAGRKYRRAAEAQEKDGGAQEPAEAGDAPEASGRQEELRRLLDAGILSREEYHERLERLKKE